MGIVNRPKPSHNLWQTDSNKVKGTDLPEAGVRYFHPKSGVIYHITGRIFDSQRERWMITYAPEGGDGKFEYCHLPEDFRQEGRFLQVAEAE